MRIVVVALGILCFYFAINWWILTGATKELAKWPLLKLKLGTRKKIRILLFGLPTVLWYHAKQTGSGFISTLQDGASKSEDGG